MGRCNLLYSQYWALHTCRSEIEILKDLKHENIILMLDFFETKTDFCVITEYAQGELFDILEDDHRYL